MASDIAVWIVDVQEAFLNEDPPIYHGAEVVSRLRCLIDRARHAGVPVVYVQHDGGAGGSLEPGQAGWEIADVIRPLPGEPVVRKRNCDSFFGTWLHGLLQSMGVRRLVLGGFQSDFCIDTTCRRAKSLGYEVTLIADGHSTFDNPVLKAEQVVNHHTHVLANFAEVQAAADITFGPAGEAGEVGEVGEVGEEGEGTASGAGVARLAGANMDIDLISGMDVPWPQDRCPWNLVDGTDAHRCAVKGTSICPHFRGIVHVDTVLCGYPGTVG